jgi:hypothetical protein
MKWDNSSKKFTQLRPLRQLQLSWFSIGYKSSFSPRESGEQHCQFYVEASASIP